MSDESYRSVECHTCFENRSRAGLVSIMLGMTVCFSTLWRFPYQVAEFGGAAFIVIYFLLLAFFVYPALTAEWGLGRLTGRGPEGAYKQLKMPKGIPIFLFLVVFAIGTYFAVWIGWIVRYAFSSILDPSLITATNSASYFNNNVAGEPLLGMIFTILVILSVAPIILRGNRYIERLSKLIVPIFFVAVVIMTGLILVQPGVLSGTLSYFAGIEIGSNITAFTFIAALGQAFFSLCLGGTYMVLYGSYMQREQEHDIPLNAGLTLVGNTIASLVSIILIVGIVVLAGGLDIGSFGPGLFFGVIPHAFQAFIPIFGSQLLVQVIMALFFFAFFFAAYLPMTAIMEVTVVYLVDTFKMTRKKAYTIIAGLTALFAIPSLLSPLDGGFLYNLDIFVGAIGSVIGSMVAIVAFGWYVSKKVAINEVNIGSRLKLGNKWYFWMKYVTPLFISFVIFYALADVVIGIFGLNSSEIGTAYILYDSVINMAPYLVLLLIAVVILIYFYDKRKKDITLNQS